MFFPVNRTLIRGRSPVPMTFFRTRQWRRRERSSFCCVLMFSDVGHGFCRARVAEIIVTGLSSLPCAEPFHRSSEHLCPCKVQGDSSCESRRRPAQPTVYSVLRS